MSLFTVEQVELIRRLKKTGITSTQVVEAFHTFERLDTDCVQNGKMGAGIPGMLVRPTDRERPKNTALMSAMNLANGAFAKLLNNQLIANINTSVFQHPGQEESPPSVNGSLSSNSDQIEHKSTTPDINRPAVISDIGSVSVKSEPQLAPSTPNFNLTSILNSQRESPFDQHGFMAAAIQHLQQQQQQQQQTYSQVEPQVQAPEWTKFVDPVELQKFIELGDDASLEQIRSFVAQHNLRQQTVAQMTGISQPYVSKFLRGEAKEISHRVKISMYAWFLVCKNNTKIMMELFPDVMLNMQGISGSTSINNNITTPNIDSPKPVISKVENHVPKVEPNSFHVQRRERFIFRPVHIKVLEKFFYEDAYPNPEKREEIARVCNSSLAELRGGRLDRKETVHPQVVANWFANRRKEERKRDGPVIHGTFNRRGRRPYLNVRADASPYSLSQYISYSDFPNQVQPNAANMENLTFTHPGNGPDSLDLGANGEEFGSDDFAMSESGELGIDSGNASPNEVVDNLNREEEEARSDNTEHYYNDELEHGVLTIGETDSESSFIPHQQGGPVATIVEAI